MEDKEGKKKNFAFFSFSYLKQKPKEQKFYKETRLLSIIVSVTEDLGKQ